jgi:hypothetical protein
MLRMNEDPLVLGLIVLLLFSKPSTFQLEAVQGL